MALVFLYINTFDSREFFLYIIFSTDCGFPSKVTGLLLVLNILFYGIIIKTMKKGFAVAATSAVAI
jgi:hypothetical protein